MRHATFVALCVLACSLLAEAAQYKIRYVFVQEPHSAFHLGANRFAELVEKMTKGNVKVEVFPSGLIGGKKESEINIARNIANGTVEMGHVTTSPLSNVYDKLGVLDLPFLFRDSAHADKVLDGPIGKRLLDGLLSHKLRGLAYLDVGFRIIPTTKMEIRRPDDLKGLKIRTMEAPVYISMFRVWGSTSVPSPIRELVPMAKRGYVEGADRQYVSYWDFGEYEVFKVINETYHAFAPGAIVVNEPFFQTLPQEYQKILRVAAEQAAKYQRIKFRARAEEVQRLCKEHGVKIVRLTPEERKEFELATRPIYQQFTPLFGADLVQGIKNVK